MEATKVAFVGSMMGMFGYFLGRYAALGFTKDEASIRARIDLLKQTGGQVPSDQIKEALDGMIKFAEDNDGFKEAADV